MRLAVIGQDAERVAALARGAEGVTSITTVPAVTAAGGDARDVVIITGEIELAALDSLARASAVVVVGGTTRHPLAVWIDAERVDETVLGLAIVAAVDRYRLNVLTTRLTGMPAEPIREELLGERAMRALILGDTERLMADEERRLAQETLLRALPVGLLVVDAQTCDVLLANDRIRALSGGIGRIVDEAGRFVALPIAREDGTPFAPEEVPTRRVLSGESSVLVEAWIDDGCIRTPAAVTASPMPYNGQDCILVVVEDLTLIRGYDIERRSAERRFRTLFEESHDGILLVGVDGRVLEANQAAESIFGRTRADVPELWRAVLAKHDLAPGIAKALRDGVASATLRDASAAAREVELTIQPLALEGGTGLMVQARDMTAQRTLEEGLRQSQKLEAIGQLAGGVAHDYNNLLTGVMGFLDLAVAALERPQPPIDRVQRHLAEARRAARRSAELTSQLLAFSRRSPVNPKPLDVNGVVERCSSMIRRLLGETIALELALDPAGCPVRADAGQLEQCIMNLAINARDAMPRGGRLTIGTRGPGAGEHAHFFVEDTGTGMSAAVQERIFQPFFTTKEAGKGTGLGLAVVQNIARAHKGRIDVHSVEGQGSRFTIALPASRDALRRKDDSGRQRLEHGSGEILVVDDDPMVREVTAAMLDTLGYRVTQAGSPEEALHVADARRFDLVVSDVVMPGMSGLELQQRLVARHPGHKVLFVSGHARDAFAKYGIDDGALTRLLMKPLTLESLGTKVAEVLHHGGPA